MTFRTSAPIGDEGTGNPGSISVAVPGTAQVDDTLLVVCSQISGTAVITVSGGTTAWTTVTGPNRESTTVTGYVFGKKLAAGDLGTTITLNSTVGARFTGDVVVFSAVSFASRIVGTPNLITSATTSFTSPVIITTVDGTDVVSFWAARVGTSTQVSISAPATHTKDSEANTAATSSPNLSTMASHRTTPGAHGSYGGVTATVSASAVGIAYTIGLPPSTTAPTANAGADQTNIEPGAQISLSGSGTDPDGTIASYHWTCDDPAVTFANANAASTTAILPGKLTVHTYTITLTVTDNSGLSDTDTLSATTFAATMRVHDGTSWQPAYMKQI